MEIGITSQVGQAARAPYLPARTAFSPPAEKGPGTIPDNDSALAVIRNLNQSANFWTLDGPADGRLTLTLRQRIQQFVTSFHESLSQYKRLSEKVAGGRFSPECLRRQIEQIKQSLARSSANSPTANGANGAFSASSESDRATKGLMDARALAWLRDEAQRASLSQRNIEPARALHLLKGNVRG